VCFRHSFVPMTRSIIAGLFTPEQAQHHLRIIREHLLFPDRARLMDQPVAYHAGIQRTRPRVRGHFRFPDGAPLMAQPVAYHGGIERTFRRVESASFFGREIGLMYVHAHLRYAEAMAVLGEADALWDALGVGNQ